LIEDLMIEFFFTSTMPSKSVWLFLLLIFSFLMIRFIWVFTARAAANSGGGAKPWAPLNLLAATFSGLASLHLRADSLYFSGLDAYFFRAYSLDFSRFE
jgi:hypothetical protein